MASNSEKSSNIKNVLALIAGILCIVQGIFMMVRDEKWLLNGLIGGILAIILGILIIMMSGYILDQVGIPYTVVTALIFCILCFIFGSWWGGICLLIAVILFLVEK